MNKTNIYLNSDISEDLKERFDSFDNAFHLNVVYYVLYTIFKCLLYMLP